MKIIKRIILVPVIICLLLLCWLAVIRTRLSNEQKSILFSPRSDWRTIKWSTWTWKDISYFTDFEKFWANGIEIPVKREKNLKFKLSIYDKTWNKLDYIMVGVPGTGQRGWIVVPIFKDSILWLKEYKLVQWAITRIDDDIYEFNLRDFDYVDVDGQDIRYKILWKWKVDSIYFQILYWKDVKVEFSIIE